MEDQMKHNDEDFLTDWKSYELDPPSSGIFLERHTNQDPFNVGNQYLTMDILRKISQISKCRFKSLAQSEGYTIVGFSGIGKWRVLE
jgi:hypothetical protein